jgi:hypothetical protein
MQRLTLAAVGPRYRAVSRSEWDQSPIVRDRKRALRLRAESGSAEPLRLKSKPLILILIVILCAGPAV